MRSCTKLVYDHDKNYLEKFQQVNSESVISMTLQISKIFSKDINGNKARRGISTYKFERCDTEDSNNPLINSTSR